MRCAGDCDVSDRTRHSRTGPNLFVSGCSACIPECVHTVDKSIRAELTDLHPMSIKLFLARDDTTCEPGAVVTVRLLIGYTTNGYMFAKIIKGE